MESADRTRNTSSLRSRRRSGDSASFSGSAEDSTKRRFLGLSDEERAVDAKMLDVAEQCFMRIADLLHQQLAARHAGPRSRMGRRAAAHSLRNSVV